jgi:predicted nucleotidyltransferase
MSLKKVLESIADFFERESLEYALIGAFALYGFGYIRATKDVDFVVRIESQSKIKNFFEKLGFDTIHCTTAFSNHVHPVGGVRVDMMYVQGGTADDIFAHIQKRVILGNREIPVVAPLHLIAMKLFAASHDRERTFKDLGDIREIISKTEVDRDSVKALFSKYGMEKYCDDIIG